MSSKTRSTLLGETEILVAITPRTCAGDEVRSQPVTNLPLPATPDHKPSVSTVAAIAADRGALAVRYGLPRAPVNPPTSHQRDESIRKSYRRSTQSLPGCEHLILGAEVPRVACTVHRVTRWPVALVDSTTWLTTRSCCSRESSGNIGRETTWEAACSATGK